MTFFLIDEKRDVFKTYEELIADINNKRSVRKYVYFESPYEIFLEIIHSLATARHIEILDSDFSETEIRNLGIDFQQVKKETMMDHELHIGDFQGLTDIIGERGEDWKFSIFTSGTTGTPKRVFHNLDTITKGVVVNDRFKTSIWGFGFNPTHFAGLQLFFQAFMNKNTIVHLFDQKRENIEDIIRKHKVTNISSTPTFYRSIIYLIKDEIRTVERVNLGGERFDVQLVEILKEKFPNAKVRNVYGATEAMCLFVTDKEIFEISENIRNNIQITEDGEMLIHKSMLVESRELNLEGEWYHTGDIVETLGENKFRFISRVSEMINVGGYNVNPHEVEEQMKTIKGIIDVHIKPRKTRITGNVLTAEVVTDKEHSNAEFEENIRKELSKTLQPWKIPRVIRFVDDIEKTRTGKKVRR